MLYNLQVYRLVTQFLKLIFHSWASQVVLIVVKNLSANAGDIRDPSVRKIPWRRAWQPTPVFLPGESLGQRTLVDHKESDMTEAA